MIREITDYSLIIPLWQEAFGDTEEDIMFFCDNCKHKSCFACYDGDNIASMLFLVDCSHKHYEAKYIYAACTFKAHRGRGYMAELIDYCKNITSLDICLIPANEGLIEYYKKHGLTEIIDVSDISFDENDEICEYLFEGCELESPVGLLYRKGD